jgi:subtilisin-like proprotein convertase family protein
MTAALVLIAATTSFELTAWAAEQSFSNPAPITIPVSGDNGPAAPYPSSIVVAGVSGAVTKVTVSLNSINHTCPPDLDILLEGPGGQNTILMSDCAHCFLDANDVTLLFDDSASSALPEAGTTALVSGEFRPTDSDPSGDSGDTFNPPAPVGPYVTALSVFNGVDPNGLWRLFVRDDTGGDVGNIAHGWTLTLSVIPEPTSVTLATLGFAGLLFRRMARRQQRSRSN